MKVILKFNGKAKDFPAFMAARIAEMQHQAQEALQTQQALVALRLRGGSDDAA